MFTGTAELWPDRVLRRTIAPASLVTVQEVKSHSRIDGDNDDAYIASLAKAAQDALDGPSGMTGRALMTQTWKLTLGLMSGKSRLAIPVAPFQAVTTLKYYDADNVQQTADLADYIVFGDDDRAYVEPNTAWPAMYDRPDALELVFVAGYGNRDAVPQSIVQACFLLIAHWYEHREAVTVGAVATEVPLTVETLIGLDKSGWIRS